MEPLSSRRLGHLVVDSAAEPVIDNVHRKAPFRPFQDRLGQIGATDLRGATISAEPFLTLKFAGSRSTYSTMSLSR